MNDIDILISATQAKWEPATTVDDVITRLDHIISYCIATNNRMGYFAALYYHVACGVKSDIEAGEFEDPARMEELDVRFMNHYLKACHAWLNKKEPPASWKVAFEAGEKNDSTVLQHLLLGVNAHINFDLGIAVAETMKHRPIDDIHKDFIHIDNILGSLIELVKTKISKIAPFILLLQLHKSRKEMLTQFRISKARDGAWAFAHKLAEAKQEDYENFVAERDKAIARIGNKLANPGAGLKATVSLIRKFERFDPAQITQIIKG
jgi:hypothetical protein